MNVSVQHNLNHTVTSTRSLPPNNNTTAIADTGATGHYIRPNDHHLKTGATKTPIMVGLPNGSIIRSTNDECNLDIPQLPTTATNAHVIPELSHSSLVSIGQLCDAGCTATFNAKTVHIKKDDNNILTGQRDTRTGLWRLPLRPSKQQQLNEIGPTYHTCNSAYTTDTLPELIKFLHAAAYSPSKSTWLKAIRQRFYTSWPGINLKNVNRYYPQSKATTKGHMDQTRKNIRPTPHDITETDDNDIVPQEADNIATNHLYLTIETTGKIYTDQTGRFPVKSSRGNQYILVAYDYDSNAILTEPLKNRQGKEILRAYTKIIEYLQIRGFKPRTHWLDNEASQAIKDYDRQHNIAYQLVPPHIHRRNAAERAIRTWKNHFIAGLCSTDTTFPQHLWDRLLEQAQITLNIMRPSRRNPKVSAHTMLEGSFDFNSTPLAPPGTKVLIHEKTDQRRTWDPHATEGWYIGPATEHYRCYRVFTNKTKGERISDTVEFFPQHTNVPYATPTQVITKAAHDIISVLKAPKPSTAFAHIGHNQHEAIQQLADIFTEYSNKTTQHDSNNPRQAPRVQTSPAPVPRVEPTNTNQPSHRYPTRHIISQTQDDHQANHIHTIIPDTEGIPITKPLVIDNIGSTTHWANAIIDKDTGAAMEYRHLMKSAKHRPTWTRSFANELGRLAQGVGKRIKGTNTIQFISKHEIPQDRQKDVTYGRLCVDYRPQKKEPERTRLTVGGNLIEYPGDVSTPTADTTTAKLVINSTLSTPGARYMCGDIKNFYLGTPMKRPEFMRIPIDIIPQEIIDEYNLMDIVHNGYIYIRIIRGMYGLPQAGIIANDLLTERLAKHGYYQCRHTQGLWKHKWRPILFSLVVDDFGVKYVGKQHVDHLNQAIEEHYEYSKDWEGSLYCGITIKWDYRNRTADLSMPGYVSKALHRFGHPHPKKPQHAPHEWTKPTYGAKQQFTPDPDITDLLPPEGIKRIQQIVGTFQYYARAVDVTMQVTLGTIATQQSKATTATNKAMNQFLDYSATHPDAVLRYHASDMILKIHSDASYLSAPKARSRAGGHFYLGDKPSNNPERYNGALLNKATILRNVMGSAAEAECGALYENATEAVPLRNTLHEMGHPQPPTPIQIDNTTADGFANKKLKQQRTKSMDMRFYWIQDRVAQKQFRVYWRPGKGNKGDYLTKHHPPSHHQQERPNYLHCLNHLALVLRGCVNPGPGLTHGTHKHRPVTANHEQIPIPIGSNQRQPTANQHHLTINLETSMLT